MHVQCQVIFLFFLLPKLSMCQKATPGKGYNRKCRKNTYSVNNHALSEVKQVDSFVGDCHVNEQPLILGLDQRVS